MSSPIPAAILACSAVVFVATAAASGAGKPTDPPLRAAQAGQAAAGRAVFQEICANCHGESGEGIDDAPAVIGPGNALADYRTAGRLFNFISSEMPDDDPGSLTQQQYYDVLAYLLDQNGWNPTGSAIDASTVGSIPLAP
ncbi:MAG TPA: c-type cytochrome [Chloroflexota bacterium]|nr:c-type cytochrome [Chloroflexota bacterium]